MDHDAMGEVAVERAVIRRLLAYARAVDRRDFAGIAACYWPGARDERDNFTGSAEELVAWLREVLPGVAVSTHQLTNMWVDVVSPTEATSEAYCLNVSVFAGPPERHLVTHLRYLDRFEQRDGEWRIAARHVVRDWSRPPPSGFV